jgi:lysophospholipase L1-like esterase
VISVSDGGVPNAQVASGYRKSDGSILMLNMAITGTHLNTGGFPDLVPLAPGYIDPVVAHKAEIPSGVATRRYLFVNAMGSNDSALGGASTPADYATQNAAASVARKTAGFDLCAMTTLLPRNDGPMTEPNRTAYNSLLTDASWRASNNIDYVVDLASEATMGNPATCANTTYYIDGIHPTSTGHALLASIAASVWSTILATF